LRSRAEYAPDGTRTRHTVYGRDDLGRTTNVETPEDNTDFTYDKASNLTVYNDIGGSVAYRYNEADQLTAIQLPFGDCTNLTYANPGTDANKKCVTFRVDDDGRRTGIKYPGGSAVQTTDRDDSGRIQRIIAKTGSTSQLDLAYDYKEAGVDTSLVNAVTDAVTGKKTTYTHDKQDRLTVASTAGGHYEKFDYDKVGNRTKYYNASGGAAVATSTYNTANQLTAATGVTPTGATIAGSTFSYDANGNETAAKSAIARTTSYGGRDQATSFSPASGSGICQTYSGTGNQDRVTSGATTFVNSALAPTPAYSITGNTKSWTVRDPDGKLIALRVGANANSTSDYYPFTDVQDNVRAMVTASGVTPEVSYTYSAYGSTLTTSGGLVQPYRYGGGYTDASTGLIKLGLRYYDPIHGRFTQPDPTGQEDHPYLYSLSSPVSYNDPEGDFAFALAAPVLAFSGPPGWAIAAGIGVVAAAGAGIYYAKKQSKRSGKERATDVPTGAKGESIKPGESREEAINRILKKPGMKATDRSKVRKYLDRK
jgi:RHS repeat-associated protein